MMFKTLMFTLTLILLARPAWSTEPPKLRDVESEWCVDQGPDGMASIDLIKRQLNRADRTFPNVPPEEDEYLQVESQRLLRLYSESFGKGVAGSQDIDRQWQALQNRPYYYIWRMRRELVGVRKVIEQVEDASTPTWLTVYTKNQDAEMILRLSQGLYRLSTYEDALKDLENRTDRQTLERAKLSSIGFDFFVSQFIECHLAKIMGPQPFYPARPSK
jgi:hypothetical protein